MHAKNHFSDTLIPIALSPGLYRETETGDQEDVKKMIWRSFRDFSFEPKYIPTSQRSLLGHPGAAFFRA
jgi:hypothetical protein